MPTRRNLPGTTNKPTVDATDGMTRSADRERERERERESPSPPLRHESETGNFSPVCARLHYAKKVGLALAVTRAGSSERQEAKGASRGSEDLKVAS